MSAETAVEVAPESTEFDPFLLRSRPACEFVGSEDAGEGRRRVHVERRLEAGRSLVVANTLVPEGAGAYRLVVTPR